MFINVPRNISGMMGGPPPPPPPPGLLKTAASLGVTHKSKTQRCFRSFASALFIATCSRPRSLSWLPFPLSCCTRQPLFQSRCSQHFAFNLWFSTISISLSSLFALSRDGRTDATATAASRVWGTSSVPADHPTRSPCQEAIKAPKEAELDQAAWYDLFLIIENHRKASGRCRSMHIIAAFTAPACLVLSTSSLDYFISCSITTSTSSTRSVSRKHPASLARCKHRIAHEY